MQRPTQPAVVHTSAQCKAPNPQGAITNITARRHTRLRKFTKFTSLASVCALIAHAILSSSIASAEPDPLQNFSPRTIWEYARQPGLRQAERALHNGQRHLLHAQIGQYLLRNSYLRPPRPEFNIRRDLLQARAQFEFATRHAPQLTRAWTGLAETLDALGEYTQAESAIEQALTQLPDGPERAEALFHQGVLLTRLHRFAEARQAYLQSALATTDLRAQGVALCNLAETNVYLGELDRAIEMYHQCIDRRPTEADGWWGLASAHDRAGHQADAQYAAEQALLIDPDLTELTRDGVFYVPDYDVHYYLALGREAQGRISEAIDEWHTYLALGGSQGPWAHRAREHLARLEATQQPARNTPRRHHHQAR